MYVFPALRPDFFHLYWHMANFTSSTFIKLILLVLFDVWSRIGANDELLSICNQNGVFGHFDLHQIMCASATV